MPATHCSCTRHGAGTAQSDQLRATLVAGQAYALDRVRVLDAPQLGARARLPRGLEARANWSRSARAPEFLELFGNQGDVLGNQLVPESGENWDAGCAWRRAVSPPHRMDHVRLAPARPDRVPARVAAQRPARQL